MLYHRWGQRSSGKLGTKRLRLIVELADYTGLLLKPRFYLAPVVEPRMNTNIHEFYLSQRHRALREKRINGSVGSASL